jgi:hypothetical protein
MPSERYGEPFDAVHPHGIHNGSICSVATDINTEGMRSGAAAAPHTQATWFFYCVFFSRAPVSIFCVPAGPVFQFFTTCICIVFNFIRAIESSRSDILAKNSKSCDIRLIFAIVNAVNVGTGCVFQIFALCTKSRADLWEPPKVVMTTGWMSQFLPSAGDFQIFCRFNLSLAASSEYLWLLCLLAFNL